MQYFSTVIFCLVESCLCCTAHIHMVNGTSQSAKCQLRLAGKLDTCNVADIKLTNKLGVSFFAAF